MWEKLFAYKNFLPIKTLLMRKVPLTPFPSKSISLCGFYITTGSEMKPWSAVICKMRLSQLCVSNLKEALDT